MVQSFRAVGGHPFDHTTLSSGGRGGEIPTDMNPHNSLHALQVVQHFGHQQYSYTTTSLPRLWFSHRTIFTHTPYPPLPLRFPLNNQCKAATHAAQLNHVSKVLCFCATCCNSSHYLLQKSCIFAVKNILFALRPFYPTLLFSSLLFSTLLFILSLWFVSVSVTAPFAPKRGIKNKTFHAYP